MHKEHREHKWDQALSSKRVGQPDCGEVFNRESVRPYFDLGIVKTDGELCKVLGTYDDGIESNYVVTDKGLIWPEDLRPRGNNVLPQVDYGDTLKATRVRERGNGVCYVGDFEFTLVQESTEGE